MARIEKTEITIESDLTVIVRHRRFVRRWCDSCGHETDFASVQPEANFLQTISDLKSKPDLHMGNGKSGKRLVCMESLLKTTQMALINRSKKTEGK